MTPREARALLIAVISGKVPGYVVVAELDLPLEPQSDEAMGIHPSRDEVNQYWRSVQAIIHHWATLLTEDLPQ